MAAPLFPKPSCFGPTSQSKTSGIILPPADSTTQPLFVDFVFTVPSQTHPLLILNMLWNPPKGKSFRELYDLETLEPTKEWFDLHLKVKTELIELGVPLKYP